jgi:queuine tRNA-ribosyltransferase
LLAAAAREIVDHDDLRLASLEGTLERGPWTGIAIGGLSVGEPKPVMHRVLELLGPALPAEVPRYLMGVGFPPDLLEGIARGVDLFDCVAATRNGRHGARGPGRPGEHPRRPHRGSAAIPPVIETCSPARDISATLRGGEMLGSGWCRST